MKKSTLGVIALVALAAAAYNTYTSSTPNDRAHDTTTTTVDAAPTTSSQNCDPNYSGCVPIASDVDCAGGPGNGPAYVTGPIKVIGTDIYKLDGDGDGIACE